MKHSDKFSFRKRFKSFTYAFNGLSNFIKNEHNARIHLLAMICVIILGFLLKIEPTEWIAIIIVIGLVFLTELFNTAIEELANIIEPKWNIKIGYIKDLAAGAVFISAIISVIVGCLIFIPKIIELLKSFS